MREPTRDFEELSGAQTAAPAPAVSAAPAAASARAGQALSPAGLITLQRAVGNRAARRVLARDKTLDDQVFELTQKINGASPVSDALKAQAKTLAATCWAGRSASIDDARRQVRQIVGALMGNGARDAGIDIAKTADAEVQKSAMAQMSATDVASEESYAVSLGRLAGVTIAAPTAAQSTTAWLDANTEKIGQAFQKLQDAGISSFKGGDLSLELASQLLTKMFRAATDAEGDIKPDTLGKLSKLGVDPQTKEIIADCDVWATYGARLFRAMGWTTVSYLSIIPDEKSPSDPSQDRAGHAVVLLKKDDGSGGVTYAGISDFMVRKFAATTETAARDELLTFALEIYDPKLKLYKSYYLTAGTGGAYDVRILDPAKNGLTPWKTVP